MRSRNLRRSHQRQRIPGAALRYIICSLVLAAFLWLVKAGLYSALDAYGFWPFMAICGGLTTLTVAAAFGWDYYEARR